jgi:hypothetical protein
MRICSASAVAVAVAVGAGAVPTAGFAAGTGAGAAFGAGAFAGGATVGGASILRWRRCVGASGVCGCAWAVRHRCVVYTEGVYASGARRTGPRRTARAASMMTEGRIPSKASREKQDTQYPG